MSAVWENQAGGLTFALGTGWERVFVKWSPTETGIDLAVEAEKLAWAAPFTPVPKVLGGGADVLGSWLILQPLPGENAVSERWKSDPRGAVLGIARGLREFHQALPAAHCPFTWSREERVEEALRLPRPQQPPAEVRIPGQPPRALPEALAGLTPGPAVDRLVVCQGDACAPNTLLGPDGSCSGHVDLGALGVADRWADLAVASWSLEWNYGPGWGELFLEAYGVEPDQERLDYYRLLWELGP